MPMTPEQAAQLDAAIVDAAAAALRADAATQTLLTLRADFLDDPETGPPPVDPPVDPPYEPPPDVGGSYPASAAWQARRAFICANAGVGKATPLVRIASQADLVANHLPGAWVGGAGGNWNLVSGGPFKGLDICGQVYYDGAAQLVMDRCKVQGVRYGAKSGKGGGRFSYLTVYPQPGMPLGQGGINMYGQTGWVIDHCDVWGFADGSQVVGPGTIRDSWFHDLAVGRTPSGIVTHNDGCQNYGGQVVVERTVYDMGGTANSTNGALFCSKAVASFVATELFAEVTRPDVNVIHAWDSTQGIVINGGRVSKMGRVIGKVTMNGVVRD